MNISPSLPGFYDFKTNSPFKFTVSLTMIQPTFITWVLVQPGISKANGLNLADYKPFRKAWVMVLSDHNEENVISVIFTVAWLIVTYNCWSCGIFLQNSLKNVHVLNCTIKKKHPVSSSSSNKNVLLIKEVNYRTDWSWQRNFSNLDDHIVQLCWAKKHLWVQPWRHYVTYLDVNGVK